MTIAALAANYEKATNDFFRLIDGLEESDLDKNDGEGWTPRQVIHHLADSEAQSYARLRRLVAEPGTTIQGYDEGKWAENSTLGYRSEDIQVSLDVIKAVRESSYLLVTRLKESDLELSGVHTESGKYTVKNWLETYSKHPVDHANQIREQIK